MTLRRFVKKLPGVLQTEVQKEFYAATFDQVFNPANVEAAQGFIGRRSSDVLDPLVDTYLEEPTKLRAAYQLEPIAYAVNAALEDTNHFFYEDMINYLSHKGGNVGNHDRLFADLYYSFAPPIDIDKFLNYQNYLWLEGDGTDPTNTAPIAYVTSTLNAANFDLLIEGTYDPGTGALPGIVGNTTYNTAQAGGLLFPDDFALTSGMRITFEGSASYSGIYYVEGVGRGIRLVSEESVLGYDGPGTTVDLTTPDYITIERGSCERSAWARTNRWFHEDAVDAVTQLGQLQGGTILAGGTGYNVGDVLFVNIGDGIGGAFIVTEVDGGGAGPGVITDIAVYGRGSDYTFAQVDQTGVPSPSVPLQWDSEDPLIPSNAWDPIDVIDNPSGYITIVSQTEADFDNSPTTEGTYVGGTGHNIGDFITMSDGSIIEVTSEAGNVIDGFIINSITDGGTPIATNASTLTQASTTGGGIDFTITVGVDNVQSVYFWDDNTITIGLGANALIDGNLGTAVSRSNKASRPIIEFKRDLELYDYGTRYVGEVDVAAATETFGNIQGQPSGTTDVDGVTLTTGMTLIFLDPDTIPSFLSFDEFPDGGVGSGTRWDEGPWEVDGVSGAITRFVWSVDADGPTIVLTPKELPLANPDLPLRTLVEVGETVTVTQGDTWAGYSFYQFENISTEEFYWRAGQQKFGINVSPLFNLYDTSGYTLDDTLQYPDSDFIGSEIFSYKILTQERLNELGGGQLVNDSVLGFPLESQGFRQLGDVLFENDLEATRHNYTPVGLAETEINGYYFYKQNVVDDADCTILDENYLTNWKTSTQREVQRVIDRYLTVEGQYEFEVSVEPVVSANGLECVVVEQGRRLNTDEYAYISATQRMRLFDKPTEKQGKIGTGTKLNFVFNIQDNIEITVDGLYQEEGVDYTVGGTPGNIEIFFVVAPLSGAFIQATNRAPKSLEANLVVEILSCTFDIVEDSDLGYFEIPNGLENNPNNLEITEKSWNELTPHFTSIITEQEIYEGSAFGAGNNYRDTAKDGSLGTYALQNQSPMLKAMFCSSDSDLDIIDAIRFNGSEYTRFKNKYVKMAQQLLNEGFVDFNASNPVVVSEWVDEILRRIIRGREYNDAFSDTYMIAWNNVYDEEEFTAGGISGIFTTTNFVDLEDKRNAMYVYVDGVIQCVDRDYDITNFNPIQVTFKDALIPTGGASVVIRLYENTSPAHIPATPSKLGLYKIVRPAIVTDDTYVNSTDFIIGHDGSRTPTYGSELDDLLLELETRIYNGTLEKFRLANDSGDGGSYSVPLVRDTHKPGKFRDTRWSLTEWNDLIKQSFFKWAASNKADYITNGYYDNSDLWTWNYKTVTDVDGELLPSGYWRGIFDYYYDTQTPDTTPWEMLGFHTKPVWWEAAPNTGDGWMGYGTGPWVDTDDMWVDIEAGLVRRQYDEVNGEPNVSSSEWDYLVTGYTDTRYARPGLVASYLPVDNAGALKATPLEAIDVSASLSIPSTTDAEADYTWGDWAPIEYAWRTSEAYPYAVMEALFLARPGEFGEKMWDPEHIFEAPIDNEQILTNEDDLRKRVGNSTLYVHGETKSGVAQINTGYQVWITGRLRTLKKNPGTDFGALLRTLDVKLGHKVAGFTDKDTMRVFVEGISVSSAATNLLVPSENIDVALFTGAPAGDYIYTGVLIKALANNEYQMFGYDILKGEFEYYERNELSGVSTTNVGGQPAKFTTYSQGTSYTQGEIVRLNGIFYRAKETHVSDTFDTTKWTKLQSLPITGGIAVSHKSQNTGNKLVLEYGDTLSGPQAVYDFLIGLGEVQEEMGWQFEEPNLADGGINDWQKIAKDFLFWVGSQWEEGSLIMLSPLGEKVVLEVQEGYPGNVEKISNGVYSILDKTGVAIDPRNTVINREDRRIEIEPDLDQIGIYGLRASTYETENIITFDNTTVFNDIIYDPVLGSRLARLDFRGRRTLDWTGKLEAAGFIITADGLLPNYENMVDSIRDYHNTEVQLDTPGLENTARHLIGFDERDYFTDLGVLDDAQFQFYQGLVRQKGTKQAIQKLERNQLVTSIDDELKIVEEWALRVGEFGAVCRNQYTEFLIAASEVKDDPQLVQLSYPASKDAPSPRAFDASDIGVTGDLDATADTIQIVSHGYRTGAAKVYGDGGGTAPGGLVDGTVYYVIVVDTDTIQLASSRANATATVPVYINLTVGTGNAHTFTEFPSGRVTAVDVISATNTYTIAPTVFITNHPDDSTGSGATATSVLDTDGTILRIDVLNPGTGYTLPPQVAIGLPTISATSDRATTRIRFDITTDIASDDVILIDIDDETRWITKPSSIACDVAQELWPEDALDTYRTTNAGYVHKDDITFQAFDVDAIDNVINNTTLAFTQGQTIWVARDPSEEFGVYYLDNYKVSTIDAQTEANFDGVTAGQGSFNGGTGYGNSERIIMNDGTEILVDLQAGGVVTEFTIDVPSTTAVAGRGATTLTAVSSNVSGNNDFTLTLGVLNEESGAALPGTGSTLTQNPTIANDGRVTFSSLPREDVIKAQLEIEVDGVTPGEVSNVTVIDGGFGYRQGGTFTISDATHGSERNTNEADAVITYTVSNGVVDGATVTTAGTGYARNVATATINGKGSGYAIGDVLTLTGGTALNSNASVDVSEVTTVATQDETNFNASPADEGTFDAGTGHSAADVITLSDGSTITVNAATISTIVGQDESDFNAVGSNGTFAAGGGYLLGESITMSDGTVIQVTDANGAVPPAKDFITGFKVVSATTSTTLGSGETISAIQTSGSGGTGFTITTGTNNEATTASTGLITEFTVTTASTTGITTNNDVLTQSSSTGVGVNFALNMGRANQGVFDITIADAGSYTVDPSLVAEATTVIPVGGTGATLDLTITGDNIPVVAADVPSPIGWNRYLGNTAPDSGKVFVNGVLYDYEYVSGFDYTLSKDGTPIEDNIIAANSAFFTLMNLRYEEIASERTLFEPEMELAGVSQVWTDDNGSALWQTDTVTFSPSVYAAYRTQDAVLDTYKFENAYVYDYDTKDTLAQIPVYDPFKGILPGTAAQNIRYINQHDPARYTTASSTTLVDEDLAFDSDQLGQLWWDTSTSAYIYYEQGTDQYRRDNWGKLFSGSSVDIYEWTRSTVVPASYEGDGTVRNTTDYVELQEWDPILETLNTFYYFWVKNRTVIPVGKNRTVAAFEVANIISNPAANLYQWFSPISQTGFMFSGVDNVFTDSNNVFQINYRRDDQELTDHVEWELGRENDTSYTPNVIHWNKMVDSLCGYTDEIDITAEAYTNAIGSFNTATGLDNPGANEITFDTAHGFIDGAGVVYNAVDSDEDTVIADVGLTDGMMYYVEVISDTVAALYPSSQLAYPIPPTPPNPASRVNVFNSAEEETHTLSMMTRNALNNFAKALPTAADPTRGYLVVPDPSLSEHQQLGIRLRPVQTMFGDIQEARRVWVNKINTLVETIILRDVNPTWNASLTTNNLWEWVDWYADGYDETNTVPVRQVTDTSDLASLPTPLDGDIVKVTGTRYSLYEYNIDTGLYELVGREASRLNILSAVYTSEPSLAIALELRELIEALRTQVFVGDIAVNNNLVFFSMLNYVFSEQADIDWAFKTTYVFLDQTASALTQQRVFQTDPFDAALQYITEAKPYQTKIRDFRITRQTEIDAVEGTAEETQRLFNIDLLFDQVRGGDLSVTEMRIAKYEMQQTASWNGYTTLDSGTTQVRLGAAGRAVNNYRTELADIQAPSGGTQATFEVDIVGTQVTGVTLLDGGTGYTNDTGLSFFLLTTAGGGNGLAQIDYDVVGGTITNVSLANTGTGYTNGLATTVLADDIPVTNTGTTLSEFDPAGTGPAVTSDELLAVATINSNIIDEFFFDYQGVILRNTSFGGLPTLESFELVPSGGPSGSGYVVGDILSLDAGSGTPVSNAIFRVASIGAGDGITSLDLISGGSYTQTPTVDPVNLNGGTGTGGQVTTLIFDNGSAIPFDTTPWDQIGFESSAQDPSVTTLTGSPDGFATTIPGQTHSDYDGTGENGSFTVGAGYTAGASANDWTLGLVFTDANPDTITKTAANGTDFTTEFAVGQEILIAGADESTNNGYYIIADIPDADTIVVTAGGVFATDASDVNATISRFDRIVLVDGTDVRVDSVGGSGDVTGFTIVEGSETFLPTGSTLTQISSSGGAGFELTLGVANETSGTFADITAEESFSGSGNTKEFTITTDTPTFFMFAVVDGVEQVLNVDYFFIGTTLTFVSVLDSGGTRSFGAPPSGTNNIQLFTYIEAGDLINPQVSEGITEEMVPLDPRENLLLIADTHNVALNAPGTGYAVDDILTVVGGTFTTAMTLKVTAETGGIIDSVALVDSGEYTVLPGVGAATTGGGSNDATVDVTEFPYSFRLHNDTNHGISYLRNEDAESTLLSSTVGPTVTNIPVDDETLLYTTAPSISAPQIAWIGTERIVYHGVATVGGQDYLQGVIRGTAGTHPPIDPVTGLFINHPAGTKVYATEGQDVPVDPYIYWTNTATAGYATNTLDGTWRYHGNGIVHFTDTTATTIHSAPPSAAPAMAIGDTLRCTSGNAIQNSYFIKEFINTGEVSRLDVIDPGAGYSVGDIIDVTSLNSGGGLGPPTTTASFIVGGVDVNGGVTYVTILDRGTGYTSGFYNFNLTGIGDGLASITVYTNTEGLVLAQPADIINPSGVVVERNNVTWFADRANPGGLTVATTAAAVFLNGGSATTITGSGNALSIPAP